MILTLAAGASIRCIRLHFAVSRLSAPEEQPAYAATTSQYAMNSACLTAISPPRILTDARGAMRVDAWSLPVSRCLPPEAADFIRDMLNAEAAPPRRSSERSADAAMRIRGRRSAE